MLFTNYHLDERIYFYYHKILPECIIDIVYSRETALPPNFKFDTNPPQKGIPLWVLHLMAGGVSGPVSRTFTAPIDRIRITIQVNSKYETVMTTIRKLIKDGGILGLWRGNLINILKVTPEMSLRFAFYEGIKQYIRRVEKTTVYEKLVSGAFAGALAQFSIYPLEVLKVRMTIRKTGQYNGILDAAQKIYTTEGFFAFYSGYCASAIGILPYTAIDLSVFEMLKHVIVYTDDYMNKTRFMILIKVMTCATISTTVAQIASYPLYLIKARQQAASKHQANTIENKWGFCKLCQIIKTIVITDGLTGLYRGLFPSLVKVLPAAAINYAVYEYVHRKLIGRYGSYP